ncbi:MAG TPA: hypothetical protein DEU95_06260 [Chloroflexi bacterium]|jgi:hypothetical protein|nr:hypothetical protein [Chloroflexota bacterium]HCG29339.1 hypothetical protein [Chloroflexota bacterium]
MTEETTGKPGETLVPPTTEPPSPQTPPAGEMPPWGKDFDAARAWATIQGLRKVEDEHKALKRQVDESTAEARKAEDVALAEQKKFEELATKRQSDLDALKPKADKADRYETALKALLTTEREGLPAHILPLLDRMEPDEQLAYIAQNRETLKPASTTGVPPTPPGNRQPETAEDIKNRYLKKAGIQV